MLHLKTHKILQHLFFFHGVFSFFLSFAIRRIVIRWRCRCTKSLIVFRWESFLYLAHSSTDLSTTWKYKRIRNIPFHCFFICFRFLRSYYDFLLKKFYIQFEDIRVVSILRDKVEKFGSGDGEHQYIFYLFVSSEWSSFRNNFFWRLKKWIPREFE